MPGSSTFIKVRPMPNATLTFTPQIKRSLSPARADSFVVKNASRIAKSTSGTANALSSRMTSRPRSPSCSLPAPRKKGSLPKTTPSTEPKVTPMITCTKSGR